MNEHLDSKDIAILGLRIKRRDAIDGPRVGDFARMLDGTMRRFTYDWGTDIQTTMGHGGDISFYLCESGGSSFSGSLDHAISKGLLYLTGETSEGRFWFFHHDHACAHNGVDVMVPCRVYRQTED